ncbi:MAG: hypothetical protein PVI06_07865 [Desulfobacterales bacterium]|jgi:hypothetical protein
MIIQLNLSLNRYFKISFSHLFCSPAPDPFWEPPIPGTVLAERSSPDKSYLARVVASEAQGTYTLEVHDARKSGVLAERTIVAPVGYHAHIVSLAWNEDSRIVTATIGHDFGGDNRVFILRAERTDA